MTLFDSLLQVLRISQSRRIMRRYFVVNGFDGALTMFGLAVGFRMGGQADAAIVLSACLGAAIALGVSGVTSAYISESSERRREFQDLQDAMAASLENSAHAQAARWVPVIVAAVNGLAPLLIALVILIPLYLSAAGADLPLQPLELTLATALVIIFLLGVFLGRISRQFWLWTGLRTVLIAAVTAALIYWLSP